jgi:hypothetical protein
MLIELLEKLIMLLMINIDQIIILIAVVTVNPETG